MNLTTESGMSDIQGRFLTEAASASIGAFWSGSVTINDQEWSVKTTVSLSKDGIPLELRVSNTVDYKSSANPGTPGVTGFIVYNAGFKGFSRQPNDTLQDFLIVAAHETGHSILDLKKELGHSWGHKGTSYPWGAIKGSSPHFPKNGPIDLMRYYNGTMSQKDRFERMRPVEEDLLLLIGAKRN